MPGVSIAHTEGVAVAIASRDPAARVGIDVEKVVDRAASFEAMAFSSRERALLDRLSRGTRSEWIARFWTAKEAAAKATGLALVAGPSSVEVVTAREEGRVGVMLRGELAASCPELVAPIHVQTERRGDYVWAWTLAEAPCSRPGLLPTFEGGSMWEGAEKVHSGPRVMEANS
jgi:phosphopantetheine--protein transferase-like protein